MPKNAVAGVILAGGRGARLGGVIKAHLKISGIRLVDRMAECLRQQTDIVALSTGTFPPHAIRPQHPLPVIPDADAPDSGPVGGLAAAADWCRGQTPALPLLLTAAVDTPFFPADFLTRALALMDNDTDVVIGAYGDQPYPTNALWRVSALGELGARVAQGAAPRGLKAVVEKSRTRILTYPVANGPDPFTNINTMADLLECGRRAYLDGNAKQSN